MLTSGLLCAVSTEVLANEPGAAKVVTLTKDQDEGLGFSIRGGSEHGLGIFVSEVEEDSPAGQNSHLQRMVINVVKRQKLQVYYTDSTHIHAFTLCKIFIIEKDNIYCSVCEMIQGNHTDLSDKFV